MFFLKNFNKIWCRPSAAFCILHFAFCINLNAQSVANDSVLIKEVIVSSVRVGSNSPVPHTNLTKKQLADRNQGQDVPFLLKSLPNVVESSDAGAGIGYTGIRIRGSDPTRTNVTINGIPLNDAESQGVFWVDLPDFAGSTDEIQVQRGVGSSTNGAGAFGATINLTTTRMNAEPYATIEGSLGSFSTQKTSINLGTGILPGGLVFDGRLSSIKSDGWVARGSSNLKSYFLTGAWVGERASVRANVFSGHEKTYQSWYGLPAQYIDNQEVITFNAAGTERPGEPYENQVDDYGQRHYQLLFNQKISENWRLNLNLHRTDGAGFYEEYKAAQVLGEYGFPPVADSVSTDLIRQKWLDNRFQGATWAIFFQKNKTESTLGGGWHQHTGRHFGKVIWAENYPAPDGLIYYDDDARKSDFNIFWKTERAMRFGRAMLDLQWRRVDYRFEGLDENLATAPIDLQFNFFNPKVGFSSKINQKQRIYAFFGVGNREPNRDDHKESTPISRPKPERLLDWEAGWSLEKPGARLAANTFFMDYFDQLALTGELNDVGAATRVNVPRSHRAGLEIEAAAVFLGHGNFAGNLSFSRNKIRRFEAFSDDWDMGGQVSKMYKNTDLAFSPSVVANAEIGWDFLPKTSKIGQFSISLLGKHVGRQYLDNTQNAARRLPKYTYFDARAKFLCKKWAGKEVVFLLSVNNLFDKNYVPNGWTYSFKSTGYDPVPDDPYSASEGGGFYNLTGLFPQAGRHFLATVRVGF